MAKVVTDRRLRGKKVKLKKLKPKGKAKKLAEKPPQTSTYVDWTDEYPNDPLSRAQRAAAAMRTSDGRILTATTNLTGSATVSVSSKGSKPAEKSRRRSVTVKHNTTTEVNTMSKVTKKSAPAKSTTKASTTKKAAPKKGKKADVTELVFEASVSRMPQGSGGIRYAESEDSNRDFLVFGQPYMTQDAFNALGLSEGDAIKVTVEKA